MSRLLVGAVMAVVSGASAASVHPELGRVAWRRGLQAARAESVRTGKPTLVLFDEVPGCSTVRGFGAEVLAHPLIAEAIETSFVAVFVQNNAGGEDRKVLEQFGEPAWNNPVVRFLGTTGNELVDRFHGPYSRAAFLERMIAALRAADRPVPGYLPLLLEEEQASTERTYAMGCFWEGEVALGRVEGVTSTEAGFAEGREVVRVRVSPSAAARLEKEARSLGYSPQDGAFRASPRDDKYQLSRSPLRHVPMTALQRTRLNAAVGSLAVAREVLSPRQLALVAAAHAGVRLPELPAGAELGEAWEAAVQAAGR